MVIAVVLATVDLLSLAHTSDDTDHTAIRENLHLLSGEQHIPSLVDLPDESLCFSHTVVALPFPLQMFHLQEIQLDSNEGTERKREKQRDKER